MEEWRLRPRRRRADAGQACFRSCSRDRATRDRMPIGKTEVLQTFKPERLKQFYTDWYRPDLMAVVAVGDFDKAAIENADQDALRARCRRATNPRPRPDL